MAGLVLLMGINSWFAGGYTLLYLAVHLYYFPKQACANCYYYKRDCISIKGLVASRLHRRGRETLFYGGMKRANRSIYLLWIFPSPLPGWQFAAREALRLADVTSDRVAALIADPATVPFVLDAASPWYADRAAVWTPGNAAVADSIRTWLELP